MVEVFVYSKQVRALGAPNSSVGFNLGVVFDRPAFIERVVFIGVFIKIEVLKTGCPTILVRVLIAGYTEALVMEELGAGDESTASGADSRVLVFHI